jgi:uncharacterized coiled-coil DUF342 family protein
MPEKSIQEQIAELEKQLADAQARVPKHDVPASVIQEIDELDEELERLRALAKPKTLPQQIAELEARLEDARARIPKHTPPAALMVEIDELEEELEELQSQLDASQ